MHATHDPREAADADHCLVLAAGRVAASGTPASAAGTVSPV